jgi:hypothetical protein
MPGSDGGNSDGEESPKAGGCRTGLHVFHHTTTAHSPNRVVQSTDAHSMERGYRVPSLELSSVYFKICPRAEMDRSSVVTSHTIEP